MSPATRARMLDEATVGVCEETSWRDPRDFLDECASCGLPYWSHGDHKGNRTRYCTEQCRLRASYRRKLERQSLRLAS